MNSTQLDMWPSEVVALPWGGRSPRSLTRAAKALFFKRERQKNDRFFVDPDQYDLFRAAIPGRPQYGGAPTLLPLTWRVDEWPDEAR